jgi:hypothetical protein
VTGSRVICDDANRSGAVETTEKVEGQLTRRFVR